MALPHQEAQRVRAALPRVRDDRHDLPEARGDGTVFGIGELIERVVGVLTVALSED